MKVVMLEDLAAHFKLKTQVCMILLMGNVVPVIDILRFLGPVCYSICGIWHIWYGCKLEITTNLAIPVLFV